MSIGDVYMLKDKHIATWGTNYLNVYFYQGVGDGLALNLCEAFRDDILSQVAAIQPIDINHFELEAVSLFDPTDFGILSVDVDGTQTTETSAPFLAVNFSFQLPTRAIKKGSKRIGPVPEDVTQNGVIIDEDYISLLNSLTAVFNDVIEPDTEISQAFQPVVVKRIFEPATEEHPDRYRLPVSFGEAEFANVIGCTVNLFTSHQTSRRR